ncbi:MAG: phenylalanine--tRNA ligase subunit beta [Thermodesulfobacteriota bacterium]|nr:phenylalanine--tRNA ligase subunit beta [Thermodesulfobacteriota bacterium]
MKFTLDWLKQYVDVKMTVAELADRLTMAGLEVDAVENLSHELNKVHVAEILEVRSHPDADRLVLCDVAVGDEKKQIVCGAPNAKAGMLSPLALPGAVLPGGVKIKKGKIRGQVSEGMLCSARDLGISEDHLGIMELPQDLTSGEDIVQALNLKDILIDVDLTPNRPDCASVIGIGREVAGFCNSRLKQPVDSSELPRLTGQGVPFSVDVQSVKDCPRYAARLLTGVKVGPSPWWLQKCLLAIGLRPINNIVDITNFVMLETGQPLHAFDFKKLTGGKIVVRKAASGETITTLDGQERELDPDMLMICDAEKPVAVAGVMGGANSEVDSETTEILLESACFDPISIRRTSRRLKLNTDASFRFERGVDPQGAPLALERVVRLIVDGGAQVVADGIDACYDIKEPPVLHLRIQRTCDLLGMNFTGEELTAFLSGIEFDVKQLDDDTLSVTPPSFRVDIEREIDLVEEIARLKGYNEIPTSLPVVPMSFPEHDEARDLRKQLADIMTSLGFYEAINYSFVAEKHFDMLDLPENDPLRQTVRLMNPLAEDQNVMRTTLLPGLLENVRRNVNHQVADIKLFEIGKVFHPHAGNLLPDEKFRLTAVLSGRRAPGSPVIHFKNQETDFLDAKGVAETILRELQLIQIELLPTDSIISYGAAGNIVELRTNDHVIGHCGQISAKILKTFGIRQDVFYLDLDFDALSSLEQGRKAFSPLPRYPAVKWDLAVLVADTVGGGEILKSIKEADEPLFEHAEIFDLFHGDHIESGRKSVAISITYRSKECTLDDETVGKAHQKMTDMVLSRFKGQLREV